MATSTPPSTRARTSATPTKPRSTTAAPVDLGGSKSVPLVVLNNTTIRGLAAQAADTFKAGGWTVTSTGNLTNDIVSTCAYYDPANYAAKAAALALQAQFPAIKRTEPKFAELPAGPIVVVLTPDYSTG